MKQIYVKDVVRLCKGEILIGDENETLVDFAKDTINNLIKND